MNRYTRIALTAVLFLNPLAALSSTQAEKTAAKEEASKSAATPTTGGGRIVFEGVAVDFSIGQPTVQSGEDVRVEFAITDASTNNAIAGLRPSVWLDSKVARAGGENKDCKEKIQSFIQGNLRSRPELDLNTFYILALNKESSISVIDPLLGYGGSRLLTLVPLKSPGEDWALSNGGKRLFVSLPLVNQVAVVDTNSWKVVEHLDVGLRPARVAVQNDGKYIWVASDGMEGVADSGGVTVIDTASARVAARIQTAPGRGDIAFSSDDRYALLTNKQKGMASLIDVRGLKSVAELKVGRSPVAASFSDIGKAFYVADELDGSITVVAAEGSRIVTRLDARPGLSAIEFVPGGRWGFAANARENSVTIFDSSVNRIVETVAVGKSPDQLAFTNDYAYVRSAGSEDVSMINLSTLGKGEATNVTRFPAGQLPPANSSGLSIASAITQAPGGSAVLVTNSADRIIYYYAEGMAAPMGQFQNYKREPKATLIVDRSLREERPGIYSAKVKFQRGGDYDVAFFLDSPRVAHCFQVSVKTNPAQEYLARQRNLRVEPLIKDRKVTTGQATRLQFKLTDPATRQPRVALKDLTVLTFLSPGIWNVRRVAREVGDGIYEIDFTAPESGVYYVFVECPSLKVKYNQNPYVILEASNGKL